jgi:pyruvate dehydrogenase E2 component (dihydrolipoamide acetyltransferase)
MKQALTFDNVALEDGRRVRVGHLAGTGTPLVLLHGLLDSSAGWDRLARESARPCYALDLPGFGGSDCPIEPRIGAYAADVDAALRELGVRRAIVVGHSIGGAVATSLVQRSPRKVASLVLLAPAGFGPLRGGRWAENPAIRHLVTAALPLAMANPVVSSAAYRRWIAYHRLPDMDLLRRMVTSGRAVVPGARAALEALAVLSRPRNRFTEHRISYGGPVTAIWGEKDALVPVEHAAAVRDVLPQTTVEVWDGVGHHPQAEAPDRLAVAIEKVCSECDSLRRRPRAEVRRALQRTVEARPRLALG